MPTPRRKIAQYRYCLNSSATRTLNVFSRTVKQCGAFDPWTAAILAAFSGGLEARAPSRTCGKLFYVLRYPLGSPRALATFAGCDEQRRRIEKEYFRQMTPYRIAICALHPARQTKRINLMFLGRTERRIIVRQAPELKCHRRLRNETSAARWRTRRSLSPLRRSSAVSMPMLADRVT